MKIRNKNQQKSVVANAFWKQNMNPKTSRIVNILMQFRKT